MGGSVPAGASDARPFAWTDRQGHAVILYLTGSAAEPKPDSCNTSKPGQNVPLAITDLAGSVIDGVRISVFAFCTPTKVGGWNQKGGDKVPKVISRAWDLEAILLAAERAGIPQNRIFVAGQSAGGWAGLLVQRWGQAQMGGLIAFAPAFAGFHGRRIAIWQQERDRQVRELSEAPTLTGLVFGFKNDRFEPPRAMGWLSNRADIDYVSLSGEEIEGVDCGLRHYHTTVFRDCFRQTQQRRMLSYLRERLAAEP